MSNKLYLVYCYNSESSSFRDGYANVMTRFDKAVDELVTIINEFSGFEAEIVTDDMFDYLREDYEDPIEISEAELARYSEIESKYSDGRHIYIHNRFEVERVDADTSIMLDDYTFCVKGL